jgi:hypothetical protein
VINSMHTNKNLCCCIFSFESKDPSRDDAAQNLSWERLEKRVRQQAARLNYPNPIVEFPQLETFRIDEGPPVRWESPIIWGDSDLSAGKRKVNLIFTLLEHCLSILEDLGANDSQFRPYLEQAWGRDTTDQTFRFPPGLVRSVFQGILNDLALDQVHAALWAKAKDAFHDDYKGRPFMASGGGGGRGSEGAQAFASLRRLKAPR